MRFPADIADTLYDLGAVKFNQKEPWRLNIHEEYPSAPRSPVYFDIGSLLRSVVQFRRRVAGCILQLVGIHGEEFDLIGDVPQKSTPYVTLMSERTGTPMISPRMTERTHGGKQEISGIWQSGQRVILCDDLRTTNKSFRRAIAVCRRNGLVVVACFGLIDRAAEEGAPIDDVPYIAALTFSELLVYYREKNLIPEELYHTCLCYPRELACYIERYDLLRG